MPSPLETQIAYGEDHVMSPENKSPESYILTSYIHLSYIYQVLLLFTRYPGRWMRSETALRLLILRESRLVARQPGYTRL